MTTSPDPRGLDLPASYQADPALATLARRLAATDFATRPAGSISRSALKREYLEGKHAAQVAAALDAAAAKTRQVQAAAAALVAPAGYQIVAREAEIRLTGPFDDDLHQRLKRLGGYWDGSARGNTKAWILPADKAASLKRVLANWAGAQPERAEQALAARQAVAAQQARAKLEQWVGYVEQDAQQGRTYAKGLATLQTLGLDQHPDLVARVAAARARVAQWQAAQAAAAAPPPGGAAPGALARTYLTVPYDQKDLAKHHGARWDPARRAWYVAGEVPAALHPFWPQRPLPADHFRIGGGEGYGWRAMRPGEVIPNPHRDGPAWLVVVAADKTYYREEGLSFGVGDESGYVFHATVRPATAEESAPLAAQAARRAERQALAEGVTALAARFRAEGERPAGSHQVAGERLLDTQNLYGGGDWWVIQPDAIWYVQNNGADGDDWSRNNVRTGGAGAMGWRLPYDPAVAEQLRVAQRALAPGNP